jgi:peptidoglycan/xylan/chitin deacetylase (PgdA/CDA1 family)
MFVLMFHSVGNENSNWYRNWLSCSLIHFERFCAHLKKKGYNTLFLKEWYKLQDRQKDIAGKEIVLTFDDGYLDNWVLVYPILKKYNLKGTIFINPEFVDTSRDKRSNLQDVWEGKQKMKELKTLGFLNWPEIEELDKSGVMDIQSHSMSHNFYFQSNEIIDVYSGQPKYDWPAWYLRPERKPFYITEDQSNIAPPGYPIFEFGRALGLRRYFPDIRLIDYSIELYGEDNKRDISNRISLLNDKVKEWPGQYETDEEMEKRYRYELFESKSILEEKLKKKIEFLCWPGGGYNELSIRLSKEAGYKASTIASRERHRMIDNSGDYKRIQRYGMGSFIKTGKAMRIVKNPNFLIHCLKGKMGNQFYLNFNRSRKLIYILRDKF